jgi:hypothetical protein
MSTKPVTIKGLQFWIGEFLDEGKGWVSINRFLHKERRQGRIQFKDIAKAKRSYNLHRSRHPDRFPALPKSTKF